MWGSDEYNNNPSPQDDTRACLCKDRKTYSRSCCDGSLWAQGIGNITGGPRDFNNDFNKDFTI